MVVCLRSNVTRCLLLSSGRINCADYLARENLFCTHSLSEIPYSLSSINSVIHWLNYRSKYTGNVANYTSSYQEIPSQIWNHHLQMPLQSENSN